MKFTYKGKNAAGCDVYTDETGETVVTAPGKKPDAAVRDLQKPKASMRKFKKRNSLRNEAQRRIVRKYPLWKQMELLIIGGAEFKKMREYITKVQQASNALEDEKSKAKWPKEPE